MKTNCDTCKKEYSLRPSRYARSEHHYCSKACKPIGADVECTGCGKFIHREPKQIASIEKPFCTRACQSAYYEMVSSVNCSACGTAIKRYKTERESNISGVYYCSNECRSDHGNRYTEVACVVCQKMFDKATADLERYPTHCCSIECRAKNNDKRIDVPCTECGITVSRPPSLRDTRKVFCSEFCHNKNQDTKIDCICAKCGKAFRLSPIYVERTLHDKNFCSTECSSKFYHEESYVESLLSAMLSAEGLVHARNDRTVIKPLELDIWIPDKRVAIEINGPAHYKPIFGAEALAGQRARDKRKRELCKELGIKLRVVKPANCRNGVMHRRFKAVIREVKNEEVI